MNWQVSYNANPTLIANTLASTPHKTLRKNSKMTLQLNGILASVLEAKGAGSTLAETSLKQYSSVQTHYIYLRYGEAFVGLYGKTNWDRMLRYLF